MPYLHSLLFILLLSFASCSGTNNDDADQIREYLQANNIPAKDTLGIFVYISEPGSPDKPNSLSTIELSYTGRYIDGVIFDKVAEGNEIKMKLSAAIPGLQNGLRLFGKKGNGTIFIPSVEAYGSNPPFGIRENAILIYDVSVNNF